MFLTTWHGQLIWCGGCRQSCLLCRTSTEVALIKPDKYTHILFFSVERVHYCSSMLCHVQKMVVPLFSLLLNHSIVFLFSWNPPSFHCHTKHSAEYTLSMSGASFILIIVFLPFQYSLLFIRYPTTLPALQELFDRAHLPNGLVSHNPDCVIIDNLHHYFAHLRVSLQWLSCT